MSTITVPASVYRPKRVPRVLRKQAALIRLLGFLSIVAVLAMLVAWRNFTVQQLTIDVARQRTQLLQLDQEIAHLTASIEAAAPYNEVSSWAIRTHGWKSRAGRVDTVKVIGLNRTNPHSTTNGASSLSE